MLMDVSPTGEGGEAGPSRDAPPPPAEGDPFDETARGENGGRVLQSLPAAVKVQKRRGQL
ncbi:hypothetical protein T484DRAFT_1858131 [Baffinella frigidus]|nr:hypothetical protein T484DRAFT_1858131 [Cryptophyta sp. CCMP2293]